MQNILNESDNKLPPSNDEIEISIFGPGYGECILIHYCNDQYIIIDSCIDPLTKKPSALSYLNEINIDPAKAVKYIIATHWHDDHIRGLSEIYNMCTNAEFYCSGALQYKEFIKVALARSKNSMLESSGVDEFYNILQIIKKRKKQLRFASANKILDNNPFIVNGNNCLFEMYSLSPSDKAIELAYQEISKLIPQPLETKNRIVLRNPNHFSVVLLLRLGDLNILLGSDLENTQEPESGWTAILNSSGRPKLKSKIFKIPHHGSSTGDSSLVWDEMISPNPFLFLTPFSSGRKSLPTKADAIRILSKSQDAYITVNPKIKIKSKYGSTVRKTIREANIRLFPQPNSVGHIRFRALLNDQSSYKVDLYNTATNLSSIQF